MDIVQKAVIDIDGGAVRIKKLNVSKCINGKFSGRKKDW